MKDQPSGLNKDFNVAIFLLVKLIVCIWYFIKRNFVSNHPSRINRSITDMVHHGFEILLAGALA